MMSLALFAVGWEDLLWVVVVIISVLGWVIRTFGKVAPKQPPPGRPPARPPVAAAKPAADPLQSEIDQFLRQAQAMREGKPPAGRKPMAPAGQADRDKAMPSARLADSQKQRQTRRLPQSPPARTSQREPARPVVADRQTSPAREPLSNQGAQRPGSLQPLQGAAPLSKIQQDSDDEFRQHMDRVFQHNVGNLPSDPATGATVITADDVAATSATATAPAAKDSGARKSASDIALLLAGRKYIRSAVVLNEILQRPEHRW